MSDDTGEARITSSDIRNARDGDETRDRDEEVEKVLDKFRDRLRIDYESELITAIDGNVLDKGISLTAPVANIESRLAEEISRLQEGKTEKEGDDDKQGKSNPSGSINTTNAADDSGRSDVRDSGDSAKSNSTLTPYEMQELKNKYGPRAVFGNALITHIDDVELKDPISLKASKMDIEKAIISNLTNEWNGPRVSAKKKKTLGVPGSEKFDRSGLPDTLKGGGRKLLLAPSGAGKSTMVKKYGDSFVDMDELMDWPDNVSFPKWWEDDKMTNLVTVELAARINDWLKQPGDEIGFFADNLGGKLQADAVVKLPLEQLKRNLANRDKQQGVGLQPGEGDATRIFKDQDKLTGKESFSSLEEALGLMSSDVTPQNDDENGAKVLEKDDSNSKGDSESRCKNCRRLKGGTASGRPCHC